ncbi:hypothetical protein JTE90_005275 [Oedothorax gibbosus]|uniref:PiggyBac transposable element-derived protein 4 C-terminal zinc-finger domain-containing protein n=1 Tax=Oedothorax gibbosus TaxID=931172 RepID=A0AAV6U3H1_9ARAC|nr:hypothetical protein JTE90_005275 [Oedothorax gibbosus]
MLNDDSDTDGMEEDEEEAPIDDASTQDVSQDDGMEEDEEEAPIDDASSQDVSQDNSKIHWTKKVKNEDIKFKHEKIGGGPVHDLPVGSSPFDFFKQFFTLDMCQTILMNTNKYDSYVQNKQSSHSSNWKPIEVLDEIWPSVKRKKTLLDFKMDCILEMTTISNDNFLVKSPSMPSPSIHKRVKGRKRVCRRCTTLNKKTAGNNSIQSTWMCEACQVSLCIDCFPAYHA